MYSTVRTAVLDGISAIPVQVEVDISTGMPVFDMVGNLTSEVREKQRSVLKQRCTALALFCLPSVSQ